MNIDFPRIITLLRKEKGVNQKTAAQELGVSQSLLSHYEKGKRECGLDFVVKCAKYYNVSTDYLLGISADRNGAQITVDEIPDSDLQDKNKNLRGSVLPLLNKKLINNSLNVVFDTLSKTKNKQLIHTVSSYLMLSVYDCFRVLYSSNEKNEENLFSVPEYMYESLSDATKIVCKANAKAVCCGVSSEFEKIDDKDSLRMTMETMSKEYPLYYQSLLNLIQNSEARINSSK